MSESFIRTSVQLGDVAYIRDGKITHHGKDVLELAVLTNLHAGKRREEDVEKFIEEKFNWGSGG